MSDYTYGTPPDVILCRNCGEPVLAVVCECALGAHVEWEHDGKWPDPTRCGKVEETP